MKFSAKVEQTGKNTTGIEVPEAVVAALGAGRRPAVRATVGGYTYRTSVGSMGGRFLLSVSAEVRQRSEVKAGDLVEVELELDTEERKVAVPDDLRDALAGDGAAAAAFEKLAYSHQQRHVLAVEEAKTAETRARRVAKVIEVVKGS